MKDYLIKNQLKIIFVAIFTVLISLIIFCNEWVVNLIWMNAAVVGQRIQGQGPHKLIAILIGCFIILFIWNLLWKFYALVAYWFRRKF